MEVIIPPSIKPVSPIEPRLIDDGTSKFQPAFARGRTQRQMWAAPRWGFTVRFEAMRGADQTVIQRAIDACQGGAGTVRWSPNMPLRGSFPATELLTNGDFSNGTTGWTGTRCALTSSDQVLRLTNTKSGGANNFAVSQSSLTVTQYAPYALRSMISALSKSGMINGTVLEGVSSLALNKAGLCTQVQVPLSATSGAVFPGIFDDVPGTAALAGDYAELSYTSLSRCILADAGPNALLQSDAFNTTWTATRAAVNSNIATAPDGTSTGDSIEEDGTAANSHLVSQAITVSSAVADYSFSCSFKAGTRSWACLQLIEATGSHVLSAFVNLSTGAIGTVAASGANWTNPRGVVVSQGNGWYRLHVTGRKASAATSLSALVLIAEADTDVTFSGLSAVSMYAWRASVAQSSLPVRGAQTTSTALASGTAQTGSAIYVKGLPVSTSNLLYAKTFVEINGELKRLTAPLDSDAAGLGYLQFAPQMANPVSDNDPIIVNSPMGRFTIANVRMTERFGLYTDYELDLEEVY